MERFDPRIALQSPAPVVGPCWMTAPPSSRGPVFGERAIGELVRTIVARLGQDSPGSADQG